VKAAAAARTAAVTDEVDVAIIGTGIIGLCIAKKLLEDTQWSVAALDQKAPCAGATGAGDNQA
jgi:glycine/D-amino acid oxidase-like deaminating enzyme